MCVGGRWMRVEREKKRERESHIDEDRKIMCIEEGETTETVDIQPGEC